MALKPLDPVIAPHNPGGPLPQHGLHSDRLQISDVDLLIDGGSLGTHRFSISISHMYLEQPRRKVYIYPFRSLVPNTLSIHG